MFLYPVMRHLQKFFDTLFSRFALLIVSILLFSHLAWFFMIHAERNRINTHYLNSEAFFWVNLAYHPNDYPAYRHLPKGVYLSPKLPTNDQTKEVISYDIFAFASNIYSNTAKLRTLFLKNFPIGTQVAICHTKNGVMLGIKLVHHQDWVIMPISALFPPVFFNRLVEWLIVSFVAVVIGALYLAWELQQPLRQLVKGVNLLALGLPVDPIPEMGPSELRRLTDCFNRMVEQIKQAEQDRSVMLAGVTHDLKTPLARMRLRAEILDNNKLSEGFIRDVESMAQILDQFLIFAQDGRDLSALFEVDCTIKKIINELRVSQNHNFDIMAELNAGSAFKLPSVTLYRVLSNLMNNAFAYGASPLLIKTAREAEYFTVTVLDHGKGIPAEDLVNASRPFVRLDAARGGNGHSGLGLAIVLRLVKHLGGIFEIGNEPNAGLKVVMKFPFKGAR